MMNKLSLQQLSTEDIVKEKKERLEAIREYNNAVSSQRANAINKVAADTSKHEPFVNKSFYIVMVKTNERTSERAPIDKFFPRLSCPTPGYNQDVFKYHPIL